MTTQKPLTDAEISHVIASAKGRGLHGVALAIESEVNARWQKMLAGQEPIAVRHTFDGYGWHYTDNGSGSNWLENGMRQQRHPLPKLPRQHQQNKLQRLRKSAKPIAKATGDSNA